MNKSLGKYAVTPETETCGWGVVLYRKNGTAELSFFLLRDRLKQELIVKKRAWFNVYQTKYSTNKYTHYIKQAQTPSNWQKRKKIKKSKACGKGILCFHKDTKTELKMFLDMDTVNPAQNNKNISNFIAMDTAYPSNKYTHYIKQTDSKTRWQYAK